MLIKMKESKGFTLVELMIVVAIIGILAAVAVPFYQRYVKKARLTSLVFPGLHAVENSISTFFSVRGTFPDGTVFTNSMTEDADTECFNLEYDDSAKAVRVVLDPTAASKCEVLEDLTPNSFTVEATVSSDGKKLIWEFSGGLADELGL